MALNAYNLIAQAERFAFGSPEKADLLDRAITAADESGDIPAQFDARQARMTAAIFGGEAELALALFAWCQRTAKDRPDFISSYALLWSYKHVLMQLPKFARISQQQIDAIADEMSMAYEAEGASMRPVFHKRAEAAAHQGKTEMARKLWDEALRHPRDGQADCAACEVSFATELLLREQRYEDMLAASQTMLSGTMACAEVPHMPMPRIMQAMVALGKKDEALKLRPQSYRMIRNNPNFTEQVALHIELQVSEGDVAEASTIAARHLPWLKIATNDEKQLHYLRALHCLLQALEAAPVRASKWREQLLEALEQAFEVSPGDASIAQRQKLLAGKVADKGLALVQAMNQRNGNDYYLKAWQAEPFAVA